MKGRADFSPGREKRFPDLIGLIERVECETEEPRHHGLDRYFHGDSDRGIDSNAVAFCGRGGYAEPPGERGRSLNEQGGVHGIRKTQL